MKKRKNAKKPKIITNNQVREYLSANDVPQETLDWYDWLDDDAKTDGWIHYKNHWYHVSDFMRVSPRAPEWMQEWDGYNSDSFFSGVLIKYVDDGAYEYIIGTYIG
jgi:hypothetical protein